MSIPIFDFPALGIEQVGAFDLIVPRSVNQMIGRRTEARIFGTQHWQARFDLTYLDFRGYGKADAWIRKVMSRGGVFKAHDEFRPRPIEAGQTPLTWMPNLSSVTNGGRNVTITSLGANFQFREGDYVAFRRNSSALMVSLHSIAADVAANGSGSVTLEIDPLLNTQHFTAANSTPVFEKAYCLMQPFGWRAAKSWQSRNPSFSAQEVFFYEP